MRRNSFLLALVSLCLLPISGFAQELEGFEARTFQGSKGLSLPYRLFKVKDPVAGTKYPLIIFLHGAGERGDDNSAQLTANAGARVWTTPAHQAEHPAYVIAPQCPEGEQWVDTDWTLGSYSTATVPISNPLSTALEIADAVGIEFETDPARQYITGLSMGGYGTWDAIIRHPNRFAAALPICGAGDPSQAEQIKQLPLWTFHGDADGVVPVSGSRDMVTALRSVGSAIEYSEYPGVGHNAWDQTYANEEVIDWLFQFDRPLPVGMGGSAGSGGMAGTLGGAGSSAGGASGSTSGGASSGGVADSGAAGASATSSAGTTAAAGGSAPSTPPPNHDASCSLRETTGTKRRAAPVLLLSGLLLLATSRRRARRRAGLDQDD